MLLIAPGHGVRASFRADEAQLRHGIFIIEPFVMAFLIGTPSAERTTLSLSHGFYTRKNRSWKNTMSLALLSDVLMALFHATTGS